MLDYHKQLKKMEAGWKACRDSVTIPFSVMSRVRKLYRELARKIHPDINNDPYFETYWLMLKSAYDTADLTRLEELKILIEDALADRNSNGGYVPAEMTQEELDRRITVLEDEIADITHKEPYILKQYLEDEDSIRTHRAELKDKLEQYIEYSASLTKVLGTYKIIGGEGLRWIRI